MKIEIEITAGQAVMLKAMGGAAYLKGLIDAVLNRDHDSGAITIKGKTWNGFRVETQLTVEQVRTIKACQPGQKITALKYFRELKGLSLGDCKAIVEAIWEMDSPAWLDNLING